METGGFAKQVCCVCGGKPVSWEYNTLDKEGGGCEELQFIPVAFEVGSLSSGWLSRMNATSYTQQHLVVQVY